MRIPCYHLVAPGDRVPRCGIGRPYPEACRGCSAYDPICWPEDEHLVDAWRRVEGAAVPLGWPRLNRHEDL